MDSEFYLRLVGLRPTMMPVGGSPSGLPGGPCASSVIILPLDPHLVDASVNFKDLGYLQLLIFIFASCISCIFRLRLSSTFKFHIWWSPKLISRT